MTNIILYRGCLLGAIAHAIMTNKYPELSYEQSWDQCSYSFINEGIRGTISFKANKSIGAVRNDNSEFKCGNDAVKLMEFFPPDLKEFALCETFQYLLNEIDGYILPCVSFVFYCDESGIYTNEKNKEKINLFLTILHPLLLNTNDGIKHWAEYYDMDRSAIDLMKDIFYQKSMFGNNPIILSSDQIKLFPGDTLCDECIESLNELNIYVN